MALPPTAPTSFVPHLGSTPVARRADTGSVFAVLAYVFLGLMFLLAIATFLYGHFLSGSREAKEAELSAAQAAIDPATVENFVRLRNRLVSGKSLLQSHVSFAAFFADFEKTLPSTVRFTSLRLSTQDGGGAHLEGTGVARNFNALAVTSQTFASDTEIKDAVFSNIRINKDNSVSFALSARLNAKSITFRANEASAAAQPLPL